MLAFLIRRIDRISLFATLAVLLPCISNSWADGEEGSTTIHVAFKYHQDNLTTGGHGSTLDEYTILFSSGNNISVTVHSQGEGQKVSRDIQHPANKIGNGSWHIIGKQIIQQYLTYPQNTRTINIFVHGSKCKATMRWNLLPGFNEYTFPQIGTDIMMRYAQPILLDSICSIHAN